MGNDQDTANVAVVKGLLEAQYANDFDRAFGHFATDDFSWVVGSRNNQELTSAIPWAGRDLQGKAGYQELTSQLFGEYEPLQFEPQHFYDAQSVVFVTGHFRFKHRTTGKIAESDFVGRFDMRDGRVAGGQFYENTIAVAAGRSAD